MAVKKMEVSEGRRRQRRRITYKFFPQFFFLWLVGGLALTVLLPPGRRRRSSRTQLTAPVVVGWWIASCASPIWTCTRKSMSTPLLYVYVHTYIHVPCSTGSPPYHPRTQSTEYPLMPSFSRRRLWYSKNVYVPAERAKWENSFHISKKKKGHISCYKTGTCSDDTCV